MWWLLLACENGDKSGTGAVETGSTATTPTTDTLAGTCTPPTLGPDPIARTDAVDLNDDPDFGGGQIHLTRFALDEAAGRIYAATYLGLGVIDVASGTPDLVGSWEGGDEFFSVAILDDRTVAVSSIYGGVVLADVSAPSAVTPVYVAEVAEVSGLAARDGWLYVLRRDGRLTAVDVTDPTAPVARGSATGLGTPNTLVLAGDHAYVADSELGLVVVDLTDPANPVLVGSSVTGGGAQDVAVDGTVAWLALGSAGVEAWDIADPAQPLLLSGVATGGPAVGIAAAGGRVAVADHEALVAIDGTDPSAPVLVGDEPTEQWSLHPVLTSAGDVWLAEWNITSRFTVDWTGNRAPEIDLTPATVYCPGAANTVQIWNRGAAPLHLTGLLPDDPRVTVTVTEDTVAPGEYIEATVGFVDDGGPVEASVCIASDDPDESTAAITLTTVSADTDVTLCEPAPDFTLLDVDGGSHTLADAVGHPVVLVYFATW